MVKRVVERIQFNIVFTVLATNGFTQIPNYVVISAIILCFLVIIGILLLIFYYIRRKFNSIDNHTNKKYMHENYNDKDPNTYKQDKKELEKDISELEAKILPDGQNVANIADKIIEFKKKK